MPRLLLFPEKKKISLLIYYHKFLSPETTDKVAHYRASQQREQICQTSLIKVLLHHFKNNCLIQYNLFTTQVCHGITSIISRERHDKALQCCQYILKYMSPHECGGMPAPPKKMLKFRCLEMLFSTFFRPYLDIKSNQN